MIRRTYTALFVWSVTVLLASSVSGERGSVPLQPGDVLPSLAGQSLSGKPLDLPANAQGKVAVAIFSFSRAGGRDARNWAQHFSKNYPRLPVYNVIFLESVPRLFRGMVVSGIKSGMPPATQDRTVILYERQSFWELRLHVTNEDSARVLVLGRTGLIRWMSSGPFAEAIYLRVKTEIGQ
jgi:hypothetical protein